MEILQAGMADYDGILALHRIYHTDYINEADRKDGFVTTNFTPEQLRALIEDEHGVTIVKDADGKVVAYAMAASWEFWSQWPLFAHMIDKLSEFTHEGTVLTTENSYQYGPICLDKSVRNGGLFEDVFYASLKSMSGRYPYMVTFINRINGRSHAAHTRKVPLRIEGTFQFNNNNYYLLACKTSLTKPAPKHT